MSPCSLLTTGKRLWLAERGAEAQTGTKISLPGIKSRRGFVVTVELSAHHYFIPGSHLSVRYCDERKKLWKEAFVMEEVENPQTSGFVRHDYVLHAGSGWRGEHCIQCHSYLILESHILLDARAFAYRDCIALGSGKAAVSLQRVLDQQWNDSNVDAVMREESNKRPYSPKSNAELSVFMLETGNVPEDD